MKRILILSPHFPPVDAVDMHRVRMNVAHYESHGWKPTVLCVRPEDAGRIVDARLCKTLPDGLDIRRVGALSERITSKLGFSAIGLRAHRALAYAGDELLSKAKFDLVFISTTAFPVMTLGARWRRRFGVPYVLDFQDPWYTLPEDAQVTPRPGLKHRAMRALHKRLERIAVPAADGLIAVSPRYLTALRDAFTELEDVPAVTIPFGFSPTDFELAMRLGHVPEEARARRIGARVCLSAGRGGDDLKPSLETLFCHVQRAETTTPSRLDELDFLFFGTGYQKRGNPYLVAPIANECGMAHRTMEHPDRVSQIDANRMLLDADVVLILGSRDLDYQPSKLFPCLHLGKPVICVAPAESRLAQCVRGMQGVVVLHTHTAPSDDSVTEFARRVSECMCRSSAGGILQREAAAPYTAVAQARRECALFEQAAARATQARRPQCANAVRT